jgi:hypothetical protein
MGEELMNIRVQKEGGPYGEEDVSDSITYAVMCGMLFFGHG